MLRDYIWRHGEIQDPPSGGQLIRESLESETSGFVYDSVKNIFRKDDKRKKIEVDLLIYLEFIQNL